jgi:hypothetical protein
VENLTIVAVQGCKDRHRKECRKRALLAGFQTHVPKAVDPAELTAAVASLACRTGTSDQHKEGTHDDHAAANPHHR